MTIPHATAFALMAGCQAPTALPDVPIVGGTDAVREAVRAELGAFEAATGGGRARVSKVVIEEREPVGSWSPTSHVVRLDDDLPAVIENAYELGVVEVLRHELCHALDAHEDIEAEQNALYARQTAALVEARAFGLHTCNTEQCRIRETFAAYCELGPWLANAVGPGACPTDPVDEAAILRHQADAVWIGSETPRPSDLGPARGSFDVAARGGESIDEARVLVAPSRPDAILLVWYTLGQYHDAVVDAETGAELDIDPLDFREIAAGEYVRTPPAIDPLVLNAVGLPWEGGVSVWTTVFVTIEPHEIDRSMWHDGVDWYLVGDGCYSSASPPFPLGDTAYALGIDGTILSWYPLEVE